MKKIIIILIILCAAGVISAQNYKKVKIYINDKQDISTLQKAGLEFDHPYYNEGDNSLEVFINEFEFDNLLLTSYRFDILIDDWFKHYKNRPLASEESKHAHLEKTKNAFGVTGFNYGSMGGFYTLAEVLAELDSMKMLFPDLITTKASIGSTNENRPIYMVKISDNPSVDEDEPEVLYTALHHAREPESMMQMIYFMYYLLENYNTQPSVKYLVDNRELYFIPVVNPDGYEYNRINNPDGGGFWRKNLRDNNSNGSYDFSDGVDLNRNYGPDNYWNSPFGGSSTSTSSETYRGITPFSEPETDAIKNFLASHKIKAALNYHSYGSYLIFPYGALQVETSDSAIFREFARDMTYYNRYKSGTDLQTVSYSTRGNSDDYFYDGDADANSGKIFAMTPEVGKSSDGFWPHQLRIIPIAEENLYPNLYYAWIAGEYIRLDNLNFERNYFQPGETVLLTPDFKNKGLKNGSQIHILLTSSSPYCVINQASAGFDFISEQSSLTVHDPFSISVAANAPLHHNVKLFFTISTNGVEVAVDTVNISILGPIVPVELTSFTATVINSEVLLKWKTATEKNNLGFEIQRSSCLKEAAEEQSAWSTIAFINGNGTTTRLSEYAYSDKNPLKGKSLYRLKQVDFDGRFEYSESVEVNFARLTDFSLAQNYPNPFNPVTRLSFTIGRQSIVNLNVYDVLGNKIAELINAEHPAGEYEISFDAENLPSGIYYYTLRASGNQLTGKMILIK